MPVVGPPAYAWDWLARQRIAWREIRRRLLAAERTAGIAAGTSDAGTGAVGDGDGRSRPVADVPDWSADHPDLLRAPLTGGTADATAGATAQHDYGRLGTRAEVIAALRRDYASSADVRATVDAVVVEVAFLGRMDVPLHELGVRSAPRGMRWWWSHVGGDLGRSGPIDGDTAAAGGRSGSVGGTEPAASNEPPLATQLRLLDVLAGYGDTPES